MIDIGSPLVELDGLTHGLGGSSFEGEGTIKVLFSGDVRAHTKDLRTFRSLMRRKRKRDLGVWVA